MKSQFDHELLSSFFLWFDDVLVRRNDAYLEHATGVPFVQKVAGNEDAYYDVPTNLDSFYSPYRQFVGEAATYLTGSGLSGLPCSGSACSGDLCSGGVPSGVFIGQSDSSGNSTGSYVHQGTSGLLIDYNEGRILISGNQVAAGSDIVGCFNTKEVNLYITNDSAEEVLLNKDFYVDDFGTTYLQDNDELEGRKYTLPAAFISYNGSQNQPRALGGLEDTQASIRVVTIVEDNYTLDGMISIFRDSAREVFPKISYSAFPYGEFWHIKDPPYSYPTLVADNADSQQLYIDNVTTSKLFDKTNKTIPLGVRIGFLDFDLSSFRFPRI